MRVNDKENLKISRVLMIVLIALLLIQSILLIPSSQDNTNMSNDTLTTDGNNENTDEYDIVSTSGVSRARTGNTNINVTPLGSFSPAYLGDQDKEITFFTESSYNGTHYEDRGDGIPEGNQHFASLWNVKLDSMKFYLDNEEVTPVTWDEDQPLPDNNNDNGWLIEDAHNFNKNSTSWPEVQFKFDVRSSGIKAGNYELRLTFTYHILANYTANTTTYNWTSGLDKITEVEYLDFEVRSCLSSPLQPVPVNENNNPINNGRFFAGARNQKFCINFDSDYPGGALNDVDVTLVPLPFMEIYQGTTVEPLTTVSIDNLNSNMPFYWRINIKNTELPGIYTGTEDAGCVYYEYTRADNQVRVTEVDRNILLFVIDYTPLLIPPSSNGMIDTVPEEYQILQGIPNTTLKVNFTNNGNVDLYDVVLSLDLSNSFLQAPYYYDAGAGDSKMELFVSDRSINMLPVNGSTFAYFNLSIFHDLPKGKYLIPLVYTAWYYNNGSLGDSTGWIMTTENDFTFIRKTQELAMLDTQAHLAIEILNPTPLITLEPLMTSTFTAGAHNEVIDLMISNYELYSFQDVTIAISTGVNSPFEYKGLKLNNQYLANKTFNTFPEGSLNIPYIDTFSVIANIKSDANGYYSVPIEVSGSDIYNEHFSFSTSFEVVIVPRLPEFVVINSKISRIIPGENSTLEVTIKNVGASTAHSLEALFVGISEYPNTFTSDDINQIGDLAASELVTFKLNVSTDADIILGPDYFVYLNFRYLDSLGNIYSFVDNPKTGFYIQTSSNPSPPATEVFIVTQVQSPNVTPGSTVRITISLKNMGSVDLVNSSTTLVSNSNLFTISSISADGSPGSLARNQEKSVEYEIKVSDSVKSGEEYSFKLYLGYEDSTGRVSDFNTSDWHEINIKIQDAEVKEKEDRTNWELVLVGVFIFVAVLIFVIFLGAIFKKTGFGQGPSSGAFITAKEERDEEIVELEDDGEPEVEAEKEEPQTKVTDTAEADEQTTPVAVKPTDTAVKPVKPASATPTTPTRAAVKPVKLNKPATATAAKPAATATVKKDDE